MKKVKFLIVLLVLLLGGIACEMIFHIDQEVDKAEYFNVLVATQQRQNFIFTEKFQVLYTKDNLPEVKDVYGYGNGTFVSWRGDTYLLTAKHCIDTLRVPNAILGLNNADIVLVPVDLSPKNNERIPEIAKKGSTKGLCHFSFFHTLGTDGWKYRVIAGKLVKPSKKELYSEAYTEKLIKNIHDVLDTLPHEKWPAELMVTAASKAVDMTSFKLDSLMEVITKQIKKSQDVSYKNIIANRYVMEVSREASKYLRGPSGSALWDEDGNIIGVYIQFVLSGAKDKHYVIFEPIENILDK